MVGSHVIEGSLRLQCRQRERFGLRALLQKAALERGAQWSSVPLGWLNGVDGPFLEGGDTLLNGHEVYVGMSGCASDMAGIDWLQALLGAPYRVIPVALKSDVLHLDTNRTDNWPLEALQTHAFHLANPPDHIDIVSVVTCTPQTTMPNGKNSYRKWHQEFLRTFERAASDERIRTWGAARARAGGARRLEKAC